MSRPTVVSAPGKVLLAGGYLVLDPAYSGIVISTSSRFYTVIKQSSTTGNIQVRSPQFNAATWNYSTSFEPSVVVRDHPQNASKNKFVHLALQNTIFVACEVKGVQAVKEKLAQGLDVAIVGDNDFYSQRAQLTALGLPRTLDSLASIQPFCPQGVALSDVHKTGLGSSAALITSLVSGLLLHLDVIPPTALSEDHSEGRRLAHNLAQFIHCLAQGKVGSGFDVSAAVFGSHLYTRFDPAVLQDLMRDDVARTSSILPVVSPANPAWNYQIQPFQLPPMTRLMLADVDAGSDTPSLVGKVLAWRKERNIEADALWTTIDQLNQSLASTLLKLSALYAEDPESYVKSMRWITSLQPVQWTADPSVVDELPVTSVFYEAHQITQSIRANMRKMGTAAGVPIEPPEQTKLLDVCISHAGVIGGGVPGVSERPLAGGYDAVWLLVCEPSDSQPDRLPRDRIEHAWSNYRELSVSPLLAVESMAKGARAENIDEIKGLREAVAL
ncbi:phosphomevalonate kinase [Dendrothele bispora CBS 962.96]|uniref:Phosphomevalonate kinase n=1 Tax=Dendrothele bispora (strain CBS 962.96) TaxID=1314807 RepID=A0A4S8MPU8_DENBC|nr:phosphomevalonate kinase [Dendrothele bispora CBS 962.96]